MQLKKQLTIKKQLAVGAATAVMLVTALPALASDIGLEARGTRLAMGLGLGNKVGLSTENRALQGEIRDTLKEVRKDLKASAHASATVSAEVTERKRCKKTAQADYRSAVMKALEEKSAGYKEAQVKYLASLKTARDGFNASATSTVSLEVRRTTYRDAVKKAQQTFKEAKRKINADYHAEMKTARAAQEAAIKSCKN